MRNTVAPCGTIAGYRRHLDNHETTCPACQQARRDYNREYAHNNRASRAQPGRAHVPMPSYEDHDDLPCQNADPRFWFPPHGGPHPPAALLCAGCPLLNQCAEYALKFDLYGIWGGLNRRERRTIQKRQHIDPIPVCSTRGAAA